MLCVFGFGGGAEDRGEVTLGKHFLMTKGRGPSTQHSRVCTQ